MGVKDWRGMTRADFDTDADDVATLFDLTAENVPAPDDGLGTGDLLAEIPTE